MFEPNCMPAMPGLELAMTKSIATDVTLPEYDYAAVQASWAESERVREERAPFLAATNASEARIREEAADLWAQAPLGEVTAHLVNATTSAGEASTAAANGDAEHAHERLENAWRNIAEARALL